MTVNGGGGGNVSVNVNQGQPQMQMQQPMMQPRQMVQTYGQHGSRAMLTQQMQTVTHTVQQTIMHQPQHAGVQRMAATVPFGVYGPSLKLEPTSPGPCVTLSIGHYVTLMLTIPCAHVIPVWQAACR